MSNILGFPTNLSALWYCSCRVFHLQTTSDAQNLLKMVVEASFWVHLVKGRLFFFFLKPCYDIICTNTKRTAAFIPQYGFEWNPCLHFINTAFSPTSPWALEEEWTEKYSWVDDWKCVCVCLFSIFGKLIQEELLYKNCCKMNSWTEQVCKGRLGFRPFKTRSETGFQYL